MAYQLSKAWESGVSRVIKRSFFEINGWFEATKSKAGCVILSFMV
jgi:hypothetical protein